MVLSAAAAELGLDAKEQIDRAVRLLRDGEALARRRVNLVPSENRLSPLARLPLTHDCYSRYFFNQDLSADGWHFAGGRAVARVETDLTVPTLARLARAAHVNARPLSGMSAMQVALSALGGPAGSTVVSVAPESGGHYATGALVGRFGYRSGLVGEAGRHGGGVDPNEVHQMVGEARPSLVYLDVANSLRQVPLAEIVHAARAAHPEVLVHCDSSHTLGLVLAGVVEHPLEAGADSFGGSTHKSFPGPHKGILATNSEDIAARISDAQFVMISSHHFAATLSLGLAAAEFEVLAGSRYGAQVLSNAQQFARSLAERGFDVVRAGDSDGFTVTHQVWLRSPDPHGFASTMYRAGVHVNPQDLLPGVGQAVRLGVNEVTHLGAEEHHMDALAEAMARANRADHTAAGQVAELRASLTRPFDLPVPPEVLTS